MIITDTLNASTGFYEELSTTIGSVKNRITRFEFKPIRESKFDGFVRVLTIKKVIILDLFALGLLQYLGSDFKTTAYVIGGLGASILLLKQINHLTTLATIKQEFVQDFNEMMALLKKVETLPFFDTIEHAKENSNFLTDFICEEAEIKSILSPIKALEDSLDSFFDKYEKVNKLCRDLNINKNKLDQVRTANLIEALRRPLTNIQTRNENLLKLHAFPKIMEIELTHSNDAFIRHILEE